MTLRDYYAKQRTLLANERTFLAYLRTAISLILAGITLAKIFGVASIFSTSLFLIAFGVAILFYGVYRYRRNEKHIEATQLSLFKE
jgi:putative membrane protein